MKNLMLISSLLCGMSFFSPNVFCDDLTRVKAPLVVFEFNDNKREDLLNLTNSMVDKLERMVVEIHMFLASLEDKNCEEYAVMFDTAQSLHDVYFKLLDLR